MVKRQKKKGSYAELQSGLKHPWKFGGIGNTGIHVIRKCMELKANLSSIR
jgi:hypothetical protein